MKVIISLILAISLPWLLVACDRQTMQETVSKTASKTNSTISDLVSKEASMISDVMDGPQSGDGSYNAPNAQTVR